ncbi:S-formylglutathione hydrolase [Photorhabdus laumondii]|uniref:S-formylglutathione hydrolase n=1 Tax=Photorhabdus laumondii subsp. clarkei TaxID=2029685 RepID=A0A329VCU5_9GAMM|nr:S-formylglutathione hydrolase [Photorhabdus laumondii]RAW86911.1 S-formylglutathione hydrolase [Photorhabdus laumondii subsp. clarkei]
MSFTIISQSRCFSGTQYAIKHDSYVIGLEMRLGVFVPYSAKQHKLPALIYLSGFTGTYKTFLDMGIAQLTASKYPIILVSPDTSPRKSGEYEKTGKYNFGASASHYIDAIRQPWANHWQMETYLARELPGLLRQKFPIDDLPFGITGHCMGGHAALSLALKHPDTFGSVSALSPICSPSKVSWGIDAFNEYFGEYSSLWTENDATELISHLPFPSEVLLDLGDEDEHRFDQLLVDNFVEKCELNNRSVRYRLQPGYDHSLHFVQSFIADHVQFHFKQLMRPDFPASAEPTTSQ